MDERRDFKTAYVDRYSPTFEDFSYDADIDTFYLKLPNFGGAHYAHHYDDGVYVLVDEETEEVCGFMVECWRLKFLKIHPDLRWPFFVIRVMSWLPLSRLKVSRQNKVGRMILGYVFRSELSQFKTTFVEDGIPEQITADYDFDIDTLFVMFVDKREPHSTYYIADGVHLVYDVITKEIVGLRIEYWRRLFIEKYLPLFVKWYRRAVTL